MIQVIREKRRQLSETIGDFLKMEATGGLFLVRLVGAGRPA